jgi:hypothetical protein
LIWYFEQKYKQGENLADNPGQEYSRKEQHNTEGFETDFQKQLFPEIVVP